MVQCLQPAYCFTKTTHTFCEINMWKVRASLGEVTPRTPVCSTGSGSAFELFCGSQQHPHPALSNCCGTWKGITLTEKEQWGKEMDRHPDVPLAGEVLSMCISCGYVWKKSHLHIIWFQGDSVARVLQHFSLLLLLFEMVLTWETRLLSFMWCAITHIYREIYMHNVGINKTGFIISEVLFFNIW